MWKPNFTHNAIASDLDGTVLDYDYSPEGRGDGGLLDRWLLAGVRQVVFISNQGGLPFGIAGARRKDGRPYPTPEIVVRRLKSATWACETAGIDVLGVLYCVWHPRAEESQIERAARVLREELARWPGAIPWRVYATGRARKPSGLMLRAVPAFVGRVPVAYYGDSDEDEAAARDAGIAFVRVDRFFG
jgi:hypothetical protein